MNADTCCSLPIQVYPVTLFIIIFVLIDYNNVLAYLGWDCFAKVWKSNNFFRFNSDKTKILIIVWDYFHFHLLVFYSSMSSLLNNTVMLFLIPQEYIQNLSNISLLFWVLKPPRSCMLLFLHTEYWRKKIKENPILTSLNWLPAYFRIHFKILLIHFKALRGLGKLMVLR